MDKDPELDALLAELAEGPDLSDLIAELNTSTERILEDLEPPEGFGTFGTP